MEFLTFGDVFEFDDKTYIFLAKTQDVIYAAQVLDIDNSSRLVSFQKNRIAHNVDNKILQSHPIYCFVTLTTEQFKNRCAYLGNTGHDDFSVAVKKLQIAINDKDQKAIRDEILTTKAVPVELQKIISTYSI